MWLAERHENPSPSLRLLVSGGFLLGRMKQSLLLTYLLCSVRHAVPCYFCCVHRVRVCWGKGVDNTRTEEKEERVTKQQRCQEAADKK